MKILRLSTFADFLQPPPKVPQKTPDSNVSARKKLFHFHFQLVGDQLMWVISV